METKSLPPKSRGKKKEKRMRRVLREKSDQVWKREKARVGPPESSFKEP